MKRDDLDLDNLRQRAQEPGFPWQLFRPGVEIHRLWDEPDGRSAALLRYAPGGSVPAHEHQAIEEIFVLSGAQRDARGVYPAGSHVVNPAGSSHTVESPDGCLVLVIWQKANRWLSPTGP
ncbi:MAG TPA: cupin domain-containing protein [Polyangia bacterium]|jgi:anti-sigma factor ChrR (cupin superfamily)|nr:cupin domain-containing protein [Polyangia bacterium]